MSISYAATLELRAPGALSLHVEFDDGTPRVMVAVGALESWLTARGVVDLGAFRSAVAARLARSGPVDGSELLAVKDALGVVWSTHGDHGEAVFDATETGRAVALAALRELLVRARLPAKAVTPPEAPAQSLTEHMAAERLQMIAALDATRWDRGAAAERMGMTRRTFYRRLSEYGLLDGAKPRGIKAQQLRAQAEAKSGTKSTAKSAAKKPAVPKPVARTGRPKRRA